MDPKTPQNAEWMPPSWVRLPLFIEEEADWARKPLASSHTWEHWGRNQPPLCTVALLLGHPLGLLQHPGVCLE